MDQAQITIALSKELISDLDALASADGRTRAGMLRKILTSGVRHRKENRLFSSGVRHPRPARGKKAGKV